MNQDAYRSSVAEAMVVDEIGLSFGILGALRLKTIYQPIFARQGETLAPVAMLAAVRVERGGRPVAEDVLSALTPEEQILLIRIGRRLAVRNLVHIGCDDPDFELVLSLSGKVEELCAEVDDLLRETAATGLGNDKICLDLSVLAGTGALGLVAAGLQRMGSPFALDLAAASGLLGASGAQTTLPMVRILPHWTGRIVGEVDLLRVFRLLVTTLKGRGATVQIEGIQDAVQLRAAIAAGADRLQGDFLHLPMLAGAEFDAAPRSFADIIGTDRNVVPLSA
jgi:EAL domain-containing protein (putative c-di-GMP-specific phosphodiesterase class I)